MMPFIFQGGSAADSVRGVHVAIFAIESAMVNLKEQYYLAHLVTGGARE